jgi:hypothetical protein
MHTPGPPQMVTALQELQNMLRHEREVKADLLAALRRTQALLFLRTDASDDEAMATLRDALAAIAKAQG